MLFMLSHTFINIYGLMKYARTIRESEHNILVKYVLTLHRLKLFFVQYCNSLLKRQWGNFLLPQLIRDKLSEYISFNSLFISYTLMNKSDSLTRQYIYQVVIFPTRKWENTMMCVSERESEKYTKMNFFVPQI